MKTIRFVPIAALLFLLSLPRGPADAQEPVTFGFDMVTVGNTCPGGTGADCTLGPIDNCIQVADGETFQFDVIGPKLIGANNLMTVETLMWGSDYPHTDGIWPESTKYIEQQFAGLSADDIRKITCENAAKFYNLTN